jgi:TIR domain
MPSDYEISFYVNSHDSKPEIFDVFLCHNSEDKPAVREISQKLAGRNIKPWLDEERIRPGTSWQTELEQQIRNIKSAAVFVGESGLGPWQDPEIQAFLSQFVKRDCPVIPVVLPSAKTTPELPWALANLHWVDFRTTNVDPLDQLIWGITGEKPRKQSHVSSSNSPTTPREADVKELLPRKEKVAIELRLPGNLNEFSDEERDRILAGLYSLLEVGESRITRAIAGELDRVSFSVFVPSVIRPAQRFILDLWAYLSMQAGEVTSLAHELARDRRLGSKVQVPVARDTVLSVRLDLPSLGIKDPSDTIFWVGTPAYASFIVEVPADVAVGDHAGRIIISASGIPVAKVTFSLPIEPPGARGEEAQRELQTKRKQPRSAFASFSGLDRIDVLGRVQGMTKVCQTLDVFVDVLSLRSGQDWEAQIRRQIPARDVFFLFWSLHASRSKEVEKEWRIALEMRGLEFIDPIPLTDPRISPPPEELARLHFNDLYVAQIQLEAALKKHPIVRSPLEAVNNPKHEEQDGESSRNIKLDDLPAALGQVLRRTFPL